MMVGNLVDAKVGRKAGLMVVYLAVEMAEN